MEHNWSPLEFQLPDKKDALQTAQKCYQSKIQLINLVFAILVDFGSLWLHLVLAIFVSFGKYGLLVNLVDTIHSINVVLAILDNFTLQKKRKYLTETKTSIKIPIVFKNLVESIREKLRVEKINLCK